MVFCHFNYSNGTKTSTCLLSDKPKPFWEAHLT